MSCSVEDCGVEGIVSGAVVVGSIVLVAGVTAREERWDLSFLIVPDLLSLNCLHFPDFVVSQLMGVYLLNL